VHVLRFAKDCIWGLLLYRTILHCVTSEEVQIHFLRIIFPFSCLSVFIFFCLSLSSPYLTCWLTCVNGQSFFSCFSFCIYFLPLYFLSLFAFILFSAIYLSPFTISYSLIHSLYWYYIVISEITRICHNFPGAAEFGFP
jgi:hypothetical protein